MRGFGPSDHLDGQAAESPNVVLGLEAPALKQKLGRKAVQLRVSELVFRGNCNGFEDVDEETAALVVEHSFCSNAVVAALVVV